MPTPLNLINAPSLEALRGQAANNVGQLFTKYIDLAVEEDDLFAVLEGAEGSDRPIWVKTDLSKGGADRVNFNAIASLGGDGVHGDEVLQGNEETLNIGAYQCQVDFVRHAVGLTQKDIEFLAAGRAIEAAAAPLVAKWLGRKRQRDMMMRYRSSAIGLNTIRPNNETSRDAITVNDSMSTGVIAQTAAVATTNGGEPINIMKDGQSKVYEFMFLCTEDALTSLSNSSTWLQAQQYAGERGNENILFKGGFTRWNGHTIIHHKVIDADTPGPIGSPLLPKALLGTAIAPGTGTAIASLTLTSGGQGFAVGQILNVTQAGGSGGQIEVTQHDGGNEGLGAITGFQFLPNGEGTGYSSGAVTLTAINGQAGSGATGTVGVLAPAVTLTGGGRPGTLGDANKYFECFSGAPYRYLESDSSASTDTNTYYALVVDVSASDPNKGKWCLYSYTGSSNNGNSIATAQRLGAAAGGATVTTLGNVTWNAAKNTESLPQGSVILQSNANGVPIGFSLCLGKGSGLRAYGSIRHDLKRNETDYGHRMGWAYISIYGQQVRRDSGLSGTNQPRGYVLIEHAVTVANAPMN